MKGYIVLTEAKCFEVKEVNLISWKEGKRTIYGIDFGSDVIQEIKLTHFNYLKKLNSSSFARAIKYIVDKIFISDFSLLDYEKDNLHFYNQQLELYNPHKRAPFISNVSQAIYSQLINKYIKEFELLNHIKLNISSDYLHFTIEDTAFNRACYDKLNLEFDNMINKLTYDYCSTIQI